MPGAGPAGAGRLALALVRPFLYASNRVFATRVLHTLLSGVTRDRLDSLGEEYFEYVLKKQLKPEGVERLRACVAEKGAENVVLVSQGLDHVMRPLAQYLGVSRLVSNRLEFRDGIATGRLLDPVIRPRSPIAWAFERSADGRVPTDRLLRNLGMTAHPERLESAILPAERPKAAEPPSPGRIQWEKTIRTALCPADSRREKHSSDRGNGLYRQGMAGAAFERSPADRQNLPADSPPAHDDLAAAL